MINTVFILGAGASRQAGVPLMAEFLARAKDLYANSRVLQANASFQAVFRAIERLGVVRCKSEFDISNVESVFGLMEMGKISGRFPGCRDRDAIDILIGHMKVVIVKTIENTLLIPLEPNRADGIPVLNIAEPPPYKEFVELIKYLKGEVRSSHNISVITFNYDIAADLALMMGGLGPDYCLSLKGSDSDIPLLKLHGSLNWVQCFKCHKINVLNIRDYLGNLHQLVRAGPADRFTLLEIGSHLARYRLCDHDFEPIPVIVPPTPNKGDDYKKLSRVWNKAAKELEEAVNIFVIGYSFPESDVFFRHLYALGSFSQRSLNRFCVFDPDKTGILENRYRKLLALDSTYRFRYFSETFDQAIKTIRKEF